MSEWVNKILKDNPGEKSSQKTFLIYLNLEYTLKNITVYSKQPRKILYRKKMLDMSFLVGQCYKIFI